MTKSKVKECYEEKGRMHWCGKHQQDIRLCHQEKEWVGMGEEKGEFERQLEKNNLVGKVTHTPAPQQTPESNSIPTVWLAPQEKEELTYTHDCKKIGCDMGKDHGLFPTPKEEKGCECGSGEGCEICAAVDYTPEPHNTVEEWCCACEADIAKFSNLLQKAREEGKNSAEEYHRKICCGGLLRDCDCVCHRDSIRQQTLASLRESIEGMKKEKDYPADTQTMFYNQALQDIIKLLENKE